MLTVNKSIWQADEFSPWFKFVLFKVKDGLNSLGPCTVIFPFCLQTKGNPIV